MNVLAVISPTWNTDEWVLAMRKATPHIEVRGWPDLGDVSEITFAACWKPPPRLLAAMPNLKIIFSLGAGVDALLSDETLPLHIPLVRAVDADLTSRMSEYILLHVLTYHREGARIESNQKQAKWESFAAHAAKDFCVGVMGLGVLGQDGARKLAMMGYRVQGWSRSPKQVQGITCFSGAAELDSFLSGTDILVCLLPATAGTEGILNRAIFSKLSRQGPFAAPILINAGRGQLQNEADILACLDDGTLHAATLDVFRIEPLPAASPFWYHPRMSVTPHSAADSNPTAICGYVARQLAFYEKNQTIRNIVDRTVGY